jgi:hypothetical protein
MFIYDTSIGYFNFYNHEVVVKHKVSVLVERLAISSALHEKALVTQKKSDYY